MKKSGERRKGQYTSPTETKEKGLQDTGENFSLSLCKGPPVTTTTLPLVDVCSLERGESAVGERWHLYHTHTGRLTGFLRERQRLRDRRLGKNNLQPPWRPPYTSHSRSPLAEDRGVKHQPLFRLPSKKGVVKIKTGDLDVPKTKESDTQSENTELSKKSNVKRENSVAKSKNSNGNKDGSNLGNESDVKSQDSEESEESGDEEGEESSSSTYTPWSSDISEDDEMEEEEEGVDNGTQQQVTEKHYSAREMLLQREEMRQKTLILTERNTKTKQDSLERELESCYLEFVSEVTRDILRRNVFTRPAMDLLCQTHIHRHRHRLREDEMVKRLDELKRQIGVT